MGKLLLLDSQNKFAEASELTQGYLNNRDDVQMQLLNTHFLLMQADYPAAQEVYDALPENVLGLPLDLAAKMLLAERQISGDLPGAITAYEVALQQNPNNYIANNNLAYLYLQKGDIDKAKRYGEKPVELKPDSPASLDTLAQIYVAEKDYKEALNLYNRAVTDAMQNEEIYLNYVEALLLAGETFLAERKLSQREMKEQKSIVRKAKLKSDHGIK